MTARASSLLIGVLGFSGVGHAAVQRQVFGGVGRYLIVEALRDDLLHFELAGVGPPDGSKGIYTTPMVAKTDYPGPTSFTVDQTSVQTPDLKATVALDTLCVTVFDKVRQVSLASLCPENLDQAWKGLAVTSPATKNAYGLGQYFSATEADGDWLGKVWDPLASTYGAALRPFSGGNNDFSMFPILYALGAGTENYALFVDQVYKQMWDFRTTPWHVGMWGDQIRWYVLSGPDLPTLRRNYMELTGKPPVPPRRSFGLWVSQFGFTSWDDVHRELASLRQGHFPIEGFAMDLQWFGGTFGDPDHSKMGSLTWDETAFAAAPTEIHDLLTNDGVHLMPIEEPYISNLLPEYQALANPGYLARDCETCAPTYLDDNPWWGRGGMVDFTNPAASDFWHDYRRLMLTKLGITDHWADLGEPEQYNAGAWYYGFPELGKHSQADINNIYGFDWMAGIDRGYRRNAAATGNHRPFLLSRTGTSGIQRFGVGLWSGDIGTDWGNLRSQMNVQMHMSLSGVDFYGSDVGGFQRNTGVIAGGAEQLYTEWFADSAALDVPVRPHAWNMDKARPTAPSERGDAASNLDNLRLRYELAPYYYSLAFAAHLLGDPVFPPLVEYYQGDANVRRLGSEKMIGRDLLVGLMADPAAVTRSLYLPAGDWADLRSGTWVTSVGEDLVDLPLYGAGSFRLPFYARAGAILPMMVVDDQTQTIGGRRQDGSRQDTLRVRVYPDQTASSFTLYEDDGDTYQYESGAYRTTLLSQVQVGGRVTVTVAAASGTFAGAVDARPLSVEVVGRSKAVAAVALDGQPLNLCTAATGGLGPCYALDTYGVVVIAAGSRQVDATTLVTVDFAPVTPAPVNAYFVCNHVPALADGVGVYVAGDQAQLGAWDAMHAVALHEAVPGTWVALISGLPAASTLQFKCIQRDVADGANLTWQPGANAAVTTGAAGYAGAAIGSF